jgi:lipopolysaccharide/colanic/teichoic acid biosynthesis glycosyltransferase
MLKSSFDILASGIGLIILSPLFVLIAIAVRLNSNAPIFYRARRVGQHGKEFRLYKFRSMVADADRQGPGITTAQDQRITSVGRFLRRTKLDELPQLINVLRGEMSPSGHAQKTRVMWSCIPQSSAMQYRPELRVWRRSPIVAKSSCCWVMVGSAHT